MMQVYILLMEEEIKAMSIKERLILKVSLDLIMVFDF